MKRFLLLLLVTQLSCSPIEAPPFVLPKNATLLLAGTQSKTWKLARRFNGKNRMNMGDCFLSYRQTFFVDFKVQDNSSEYADCGPSLVAIWKWVQAENGHPYLKLKSPQIPQLLNIEKDYKFFKILHLSEEELILEYVHQQYAQKRIITDILVPDYVSVEDRDFHW